MTAGPAGGSAGAVEPVTETLAPWASSCPLIESISGQLEAQGASVSVTGSTTPADPPAGPAVIVPTPSCPRWLVPVPPAQRHQVPRRRLTAHRLGEDFARRQ